MVGGAYGHTPLRLSPGEDCGPTASQPDAPGAHFESSHCGEMSMVRTFPLLHRLHDPGFFSREHGTQRLPRLFRRVRHTQERLIGTIHQLDDTMGRRARAMN